MLLLLLLQIKHAIKANSFFTIITYSAAIDEQIFCIDSHPELITDT